MTKLIAPSGVTGVVDGYSGTQYVIAANGTIDNVEQGDILPLIGAGWSKYVEFTQKVFFRAPAAADLVSVKSAADVANGAISIAAQPAQARKLQVRVVDANSSISAGTLTLDYDDQNGVNHVEAFALTGGTSTRKTTYACAKLNSGVVAGLTGAATGDTLGIGVANDLAIPAGAGALDLECIKSTKIVATYTGSGSAVTTVAVIPADDVAATATVDQTAMTVAPTTAPGPTGTTATDYEFTVTYGKAA